MSNAPDAVAPDGCHVRILPALAGGSLAHFELAPGATSTAVAHHTVEEVWLFIAGKGELWRRQGALEETCEVFAGRSITLPLGTHFQLRATGPDALTAVAGTFPAWPGAEEAYTVKGRWMPTVGPGRVEPDR